MAVVQRAWILMVLVALGCSREVDPVCVAYSECQAAFDDATGADPVDTSIYSEFGGDCWSGDPITRDRCAAECKASLDAVATAADDAGLALDECAVDVDAGAA
jgi:hypothetical protein